MIQESLIIDVHSASKELDQIEDCIRKIKENEFPLAQCDKIARLLSIEFKPVVVESFTIVKTDRNTPMFGSHIYPSVQHLREVIEENRDETRSHIIFKHCVIELDDKLFTELSLTEREITAIILHEMGHALSDRQLIKPRALLSSCSTIPMEFLSPFKYPLTDLLLSGLAVFYNSKKIVNKRNNRNEIEADSLAIACGYGPELAHALGQISRFIKYDPVSSVAYAQTELKWGIDAINNFETRQKVIMKELESRLKTCDDSPYMENIIRMQISIVQDRMDQIKKRKNKHLSFGNINKLDEACELYMESLMHRRNPGHEADLISMEIGRIETTEDKLYLTNRIYRSITVAQKSIEKIMKRDPNDPRIPLLQDNIKKLQDLIPDIRKVKTDINPFVIKVAYPKDDYEN